MFSLISRVYHSLPSLFREPGSGPTLLLPEPESEPAPEVKGTSEKPIKSKSPAPKDKEVPTPSSGRARREAKRSGLEADPSQFSISFVVDGNKLHVAWSHRSCRPGDVDAWIGLHEVLDATAEDEVRHAVGDMELSWRLQSKSIRSTKLNGESMLPVAKDKLDDGEYVLALHNSGGVTGEENLFLAVSNSFRVKKGKIVSSSMTPTSKRARK